MLVQRYNEKENLRQILPKIFNMNIYNLLEYFAVNPAGLQSSVNHFTVKNSFYVINDTIFVCKEIPDVQYFELVVCHGKDYSVKAFFQRLEISGNDVNPIFPLHFGGVGPRVVDGDVAGVFRKRGIDVDNP